jgi:PleD family two-component response regulator
LFQRTDKALYRAKKLGKNRVVFAEEWVLFKVLIG